MLQKKQPHNLEMLRAMAEKKISLIDFEYLTTDKDKGSRIGRMQASCAYNGLRAGE